MIDEAPLNVSFFMHTCLSYRGVIATTGADRFSFLQGMITQDLGLLQNHPAAYTLRLNRTGRIMGDAWIIVKDDQTWWIDTENAIEVAAELSNKKLRYKVQFEPLDVAVWAGWGTTPPPPGAIVDTRHPDMGWRAYGALDQQNALSEDAYRLHTLTLGIPDGSLDFEIGRSMPLPWGCENAIGWDKGCYVGQEPVARSRYQGVVRQHIVPIVFDDNAHWIVDADHNLFDREGTNQGRLVSRFQDKGLALASVAIDESAPLRVKSQNL